MATTLLQAVKDCRYIQAKLLIEQGVNINCRNVHGSTALIVALRIQDDGRRARMFRWLLRMGADTSRIDVTTQRDLLSWAAYTNRTEQVGCLLDVDEGLVNVHHRDKDGRTAMHYATMHGNVDALYMLVLHAARFGLTVDVRDHDGVTPYLLASMMEHGHCREILVDIGHAVTHQLFMTSVDEQSASDVQPAAPVATDRTHLPSIGKPHMSSSHASSARSSQGHINQSVPLIFVASNNLTKASSSSAHILLPRFMNILSKQTTENYRPAAILPRVTPSATPVPPNCRLKSPALSFVGAARIGSLAVSLRKKTQQRMKQKK